jgi:2-keto-4-pentenoate hydratase/2-oxohepta-3-ene-1,7-dioic acid hydratase in catechol pathway
MVVHESELAIVIGKVAKDVPPERCAEHVFGYTCINDVTAGVLVRREEFQRSQYAIDGKIYDTFAPLGPVIVTDLDTDDLRIQCRVNGNIVQDHRTTDRVWSLMEVISLVSSVMTLHPGDVIATGSPPGMGPLADGDVVEVEIDGIGILRNPVRTKVHR